MGSHKVILCLGVAFICGVLAAYASRWLFGPQTGPMIGGAVGGAVGGMLVVMNYKKLK